MPRSNAVVSTLNAGELSPELYGRTDLQKYPQGARRLRNFLTKPEGGLFRRPGTRFVAEVMDSTKRHRLIPFDFSTTAAWGFLFGDGLARVLAAGSVVLAPTRTFQQGAVDIVSDQITIEDHGWKDQQGPITLTTTGTLPAPLAIATDYYIKKAQTLTFAPADITLGTPASITITSHGLSDEMGPYVLHSTGQFPGTTAELSGPRNASGNVYFVKVVDPNTIQLSLTKGGAALNITSTAGSGTLSLVPTADYLRDTFRLSQSPGGTHEDLTTTGSAPPDTHTMTPTQPQFEEIDIPWSEAELPDLKFAQQADTLYIVHPDHVPYTLRPVDDTAQAWELDELLMEDGPFEAENSTSVTMTTSTHLTQRGTMTLSDVSAINEGQGFVAADVGRLMRFSGIAGGNPDALLWCVIIGVQSSTVADVEIVRSEHFLGPGGSRFWRMGYFRKGNQPAAITFFEQRLALGGEAETPDTLHASVTKEFDRFSPTGEASWKKDTLFDVLDDNGIDFFAASNQLNKILWLAFGRSLVMGTPGGIFPVVAGSNNEAVTPTSIKVNQATVSGVNNIQAVNVGNRIVYAGRANRRLRALRFAFESDDFVSDDLTVLANHVLGRGQDAAELGIEEMVYAQERDSVIWSVRKDGVLLGLSFVPEQDVFAWHLHEIGGSFGSGNAVVESVMAIPSTDGTQDSVWLIVKRTINGATKRYVEIMEPNWESGLVQDGRFLDSHPEPYDGPPITVLNSGLDHLEGETVQILADEGVEPVQTVVGGQITLTQPASRIQVGLGYTSEFRSLPLELLSAAGPSAGIQGRIDHVVIQVLDTVGGKYSEDGLDFLPIYWRDGEDPMDLGVPPFTGFRKLAFPGRFTRDKQLWIRQDQPLPFQLLAMTVQASVGNR